MSKVPVEFYNLEVEEAVSAVGSDSVKGLSNEEVENRLAKFGLNQLPAGKTKSVWERLWDQINSTVIYVLLVGAALSFGFHHLADGFVIIGVIMINVLLGFIMEGKAENSTQKLKKMMSPSAMVLRDGVKRQVEANHLTIGDIFYLQGGDVVPADGRVLNSADLQIMEAPLTGESHVVTKNTRKLHEDKVPLAERSCIVFSGTQVIKGTAACLAVRIGSQCEIGKINALLQDVLEVKTPLVLQLEKFGVYLSIAIMCLATLALVVSLARSYSIQDAFSFAIGIAVAAIPEGLPSCVTITFGIGVYKMSKRKAIVKSLPAVETLGSVSVICSDKTGTLTVNRMTVKAISTQKKIHHLSDDASEVVGEDKETLVSLLIPGIFCNDSVVHHHHHHHLQQDHQSFSSSLIDKKYEEGGLVEVEEDEEEIDLEVGDGGNNNPLVDEEKVSYSVEGDPTEACIFTLATNLLSGRTISQWQKEITRVGEMPFDSDTKFMATMHSMNPSLHSKMSPLFVGTTTVCPSDNCKVIFVKGAPEKILSFCYSGSTPAAPATAETTTLMMKKAAGEAEQEEEGHNNKAVWLHQASNLAQEGMRVLGLAYKLVPVAAAGGDYTDSSELMKAMLESPHGFSMVSLLGITDPPRSEAIDAVHVAQMAGITVKMITGDHPVTAVAIGKQLGLQHNPNKSTLFEANDDDAEEEEEEERDVEAIVAVAERNSSEELLTVITGAEFDRLFPSTPPPPSSSPAASPFISTTNNQQQEEAEKERMFDALVLQHDVFARMTPEHKLRIVQSLQRQGMICSMTGDGVNDSPALKAANIGVAMGITGTEVAKDAANMIILDDNFATIIDAIRIGRCTYKNLVKILAFVLPTNGAQAFSIIMALIIGWDVPITALQILWVNMVTSITLGLVLAFEPPEESSMQHKPRPVNKQIFGKFLSWRLAFITTLLVVLVLGNFEWEKHSPRNGTTLSIEALRTIAVNTLSACQMAYVFNCRFLRHNVPVQEIFISFHRNPMIYIGVVVVMGMQALFTYASPLQYVFATVSLDGIAWGKIILWMIVTFVIVETEKYLSTSYHRYW